MANTVSNLLYVSGSLTQRDRLVGGIVRSGGSRKMLDAYAGRAWMDLGASEPRADGYISDVAPSHTDGYTAFRFFSRGNAQYIWLESVAAAFPALTFELLVGSVMQFVAYARYEDGRKVVDEAQPDYRATEFCAKHGWDGWWSAMYDEALDPWADPPEDFPTVSDIEDAPSEVPTSPVAMPTTLNFPPNGALLVKRDTDYPIQDW